MSRIEKLLSQFAEEFRRAGDADPRAYLQQVDGGDRAELAALIDGFLAHAAPPVFDADAFATFAADPARNELVDALLASDETLLQLRGAAQLSKAEVGARLAAALDLPGQENGARGAYHEIEWGLVPPAKVRPRVWDALSDLYGASVERLRAAAQRAFEQRDPASGLTFARSSGEPVAGMASPPVATPGDDAVRRAFFDD